MLLLGSEVTAAGITAFADHVSGETFHYLPGAPRLVAGPGAPGLSLLRYRGGTEGGLLSIDVDLSLAPGRLDAARTALQDRFARPVSLVPVLFRTGSARLVAFGVESGPSAPAAAPFLVERVLGTATPSLLGGARAVFAVELDREGASLAEASLRGDALPLLVVYDLAFEGLRPARGARARVDSRMAYDYLRSRFPANSLVFKADLDRETEALAREGHIQIEDVDYQGSDPALRAQREAELRQTLRELTEMLFFSPAAAPVSLGEGALSRPGPVTAAWSSRGGPAAAFVLRGLEQREEQSLTYDLSIASVSVARVAPQGRLEVPAGADVASFIRDVTLGTGPATVVVTAFVLPGADWSGVEAVQVDLRGGTEARSLVLRPSHTEERVELPPGPVQYRVRALAADEPESLGSPPAPSEGFAPLPAMRLPVDPAALSGRNVLRVSLGVFEDPRAVGIQGRLRAGGAVREFLLDARRPEQQVPVWGNPLLQWEALVSGPDGATTALEGTVPPGQTTLVINLPAGRQTLVLVTLQDPLERFDSVFVELEDPGGQRRRGFRLDAHDPSAHWSAPRTPGAGAPYRYRLRKVFHDARVLEQDWRDGAGPLLVVGDTDLRVQSVEAILIGAQEALGGLLRFQSLAPPSGVPAETEIVLDPGQTSVVARLPLRPDAPLRYRVEGELFVESGSRTIGPLEETSEVLLLRPT